MDDPLYVNPGVIPPRSRSRGPYKAESLARFAGQHLSKDPEDVVLILLADACRPSAEGERVTGSQHGPPCVVPCSFEVPFLPRPFRSDCHIWNGTKF